jgi:hypothetical protein
MDAVAELNEDDGAIRLKPWWRLGNFADHSIERAYRQWHHKLWMPRLQAMYCFSVLVYGGGFLMQQLYPGASNFRNLLLEMRPITKEPGLVTAAVARSLTGALSLFFLLPSRRLVTPERYQVFVVVSFLVPMIIELSYITFAPEIVSAVNRSETTAAALEAFDEWASYPAGLVRQPDKLHT